MRQKRKRREDEGNRTRPIQQTGDAANSRKDTFKKKTERDHHPPTYSTGNQGVGLFWSNGKIYICLRKPDNPHG
ncbi:MAG: hypothetical protein GXP63_02725 [DPANN group archaeon]|nr:hypothetical protein [DPANN group archaeon]